MTTIILPDRPLIQHPPIVTNSRAPVFYADGGFSRSRGDVMRITFYDHWRADRPGRETVIVMMPRSGFEMSMVIEATTFLPGLARRFTQH